MELNICFLAQGPIELASSRLRAWQTAEVFNSPNVYCTEALSERKADVIVLNKLYPRPEGRYMDLYKRVKHLKEKGTIFIWDLCDPVWYWMEDNAFFDLAQLMDAITVSSFGLKDDLKRSHPDFTATVIEDRLPFTERWKTHLPTDEPVMVWFGYFENRVPSFMSCALALERLIQNNVPFKLLIIDDRPDVKLPANSELGKRMVYKRWDLSTFWDDLLSADIALLPNYPGLYGRLKSANKEMTAMWAGLPISDGEDYFQLKSLLTDSKLRRIEAIAGRHQAEDSYDIRDSVQEWKTLIERICESHAQNPQPV